MWKKVGGLFSWGSVQEHEAATHEPILDGDPPEEEFFGATEDGTLFPRKGPTEEEEYILQDSTTTPVASPASCIFNLVNNIVGKLPPPPKTKQIAPV